MAAGKKLDKALEDRIIIDWKTGGYSQRDLVAKYSVSLGKVSSLVKDVNKDLEHVVNAGVEYYQGLQGQSLQAVNAVVQTVDRKTKLKSRVQDFVDVAVEKGFELLKSVENGQEFKAIVEGIDKASITANINERHAKPNQTTTNLGVAVGDSGTMRRPTNIVINGRKSAD